MIEIKLGTLILIPVTLGSESHDMIPREVYTAIESLDHFVVERVRTARRFIRQVSKTKNIDQITFIELDKRGDNGTQVNQAIALLKAGKDLGLMSEAGVPCIADPGNILVAAAHQQNLKVHPLVGPSSILLALMGSGMNGQSFAFHGYLSVKKDQLAKELTNLESQSRKTGQTQLFMETPYRNDQLWEVALKVLVPTTKLGFAADLTLPSEEISVKSVKEWKKNAKSSLHKRPTIFMLQAK
ncbi:MAG: SAM-dependent methyltransferase [Bacteroidia bacterium]|nr:SAM-dependent methyltransferase [Bacteroidia bacterium]